MNRTRPRGRSISIPAVIDPRETEVSQLPTPGSQPQRWRKALSGYFPAHFLVCMLLQFVITAPKLVTPFHLPHDDELFLTQAQNIILGRWLGPYNQFTLAKPPTYPLFIAVNHILGLPLLYTQIILYNLAVGYLCYLFIHRLNLIVSAYILSGLLLFDPHILSDYALRVNVSILIPTLFMSLVAAYLHIYYTPIYKVPKAPIIFFSGVFAFLYSLRWESIWLWLPLITALFLSERYFQLPRRSAILLLLTSLAFVTGLTHTIRLTNYLVYGSYIYDEFEDGAFPDYYKRLKTIQTYSPYVALSKVVRTTLYEHSPAFRLLKPLLEVPGVYNFGCATFGVPCVDNDIHNGWTSWAVRDAAAIAGKYSTPAVASDYFTTARRELDEACRKGLLVCAKPPPLPIALPTTFAGYRSLLGYLIDAVRLLTYSTASEYSAMLANLREALSAAKNTLVHTSDLRRTSTITADEPTDTSCALQVLNRSRIAFTARCEQLASGTISVPGVGTLTIIEVTFQPRGIDPNQASRNDLYERLTNSPVVSFYNASYTHTVHLRAALNYANEVDASVIVAPIPPSYSGWGGGSSAPRHRNETMDRYRHAAISILSSSYTLIIMPWTLVTLLIAFFVIQRPTNSLGLHAILVFCFLFASGRLGLLAIVSVSDFPALSSHYIHVHPLLHICNVFSLAIISSSTVRIP